MMGPILKYVDRAYVVLVAIWDHELYQRAWRYKGLACETCGVDKTLLRGDAIRLLESLYDGHRLQDNFACVFCGESFGVKQ